MLGCVLSSEARPAAQLAQPRRALGLILVFIAADTCLSARPAARALSTTPRRLKTVAQTAKDADVAAGQKLAKGVEKLQEGVEKAKSAVGAGAEDVRPRSSLFAC